MISEKSVQYVIQGYTCYIHRDTDLGHLCGHVVIPVNHVCFGTPVSELGNLVVHGGSRSRDQLGVSGESGLTVLIWVT